MPFQDADRKLATSRQPDFKPPSDDFRAEMVKLITTWRDDNQCTVWTKTCVQEWAKNTSKVWGIKKGPHNFFPGKTLPDGAENVFPAGGRTLGQSFPFQIPQLKRFYP